MSATQVEQADRLAADLEVQGLVEGDVRGVRLGVYQDLTELSHFYAIRIRLLRGRWVAGSRTEPIEPIAVDDEMLGPPRIPVSDPPS